MTTEDTAARLRILRATHVPEPTPGWPDRRQCALTDHDWPCDEAMLLAEIDRLAGIVDRVRTLTKAICDADGPSHGSWGWLEWTAREGLADEVLDIVNGNAEVAGLIERSSLGSPDAVAARDQVHPETGRVLAVASVRLAEIAAERDAARAELDALRAGMPEWRCPSCGATTRARMADHPDKEPDL